MIFHKIVIMSCRPIVLLSVRKVKRGNLEQNLVLRTVALLRITLAVWSYVGARGPPMPCYRQQAQTVCCRILGVRARNIRVVVK